MQPGIVRQTVDLSAWPDLVLVLLGFKVRRLCALPAFVRLGRGLDRVRRDPPDGLLRHDQSLLGWNHVGLRQYWRDPDSLAAFTRAAPHADWWRDFLADTRGCGFWHEAYHAAGGVEAIYVNMPGHTGLGAFAPPLGATGPFMSAAGRRRVDADARGRAVTPAAART